MQNNGNHLYEIFKTLWNNNLINANVMIQDQPQIWTLYTFMPYRNDCFNLEAMKIESFTSLNYTSNMTVQEEQLFPEKLNNFSQCPLHIATSYLNPFVICPSNDDKNTNT